MADTASPTSPGTPPKGPRHWPTWLALGVMWLAARLPWPVQRALGALEASGKVRTLGRGRARRWLCAPIGGFATTLLLPAPPGLG